MPQAARHLLCTLGVMNSRLVLSFFLLSAASALAQSSAPGEKQCFRKPSHVEARACLEEQAKQSAMSVKQAESNVRSSLAKWDQEPSYKSRSTSELEAASLQFVRFRDSQCAFHASMAAGGNGAGDRRLLCEIELNNRHIADLQRIHRFLQ